MGSLGVCTTGDLWLSGKGYELLSGAAESLGFRHGGWHGVVRALAEGALPDLLSEAIEAAEALPEAALSGHAGAWPSPRVKD